MSSAPDRRFWEAVALTGCGGCALAVAVAAVIGVWWVVARLVP